ncbi:hypothetical protein BOVATA_036100 [Babesia ovata]|uniref:Helicase-associated domain-containing protein n=1 Tax=Babesia ovata TaxID=189622 RepID=A0A2H6KGL5_9APIC|nr:uncharacterized protein BOVATA_036100 [Babesia ovata]GBE62117.1 hypothetical protein BOVATA_036100 [Babesia ovata]
MANAVLSQRDEVVAAVEGHNVVAFSGPTESYASSYIPFFLYKAGFTSSSTCRKNPPRICVAHSRRREVMSSAESCSVLINNPSKVACHLGSAASLNSTADIVYVTEDCLLRRLVADPLLSDYGVVILTGLQDRLLCTEILLALLKRILSRRSRLRIVLCFERGNVDEVLTFFRRRATDRDAAAETSAADGDEVSKPHPGNLPQLGDVCHVRLKSDPTSYKVQYLSAPCPNYLDAAVSTGALHIASRLRVVSVWSVCRNEPSGNVLVFVPSSEELELLHTNLVESAKSFREQGAGSINVVPLGVGGSAEQHIKRNPYASRNVYICCDLRDYRSKVDSIRYVVDCAFSRRMVSDHVNTGSVACTVHATRDEMRQRSNVIRGHGKCYRLLTEAHFLDNSLVMEFPISEIKTSDLTTMILFIKSLGVSDFSDFEFVVQPPIVAIEHALTTLFLLGAIDGNGDVVYPCGNVMAELPYTAMLSNFLYRSTELGCSVEALTICAMLEVQDVVLKRGNVKSTYQTERLQAAMRGFAASEGDLFSYFNVYQLAHYYRDEDTKWLARHAHGEWLRYSFGGEDSKPACGSSQEIPASGGEHLSLPPIRPQVSCGENSAVLLEAIFKSFFLNVACKEHLVRTLLTSRQLDVDLKVKSKVLDDEGNAILTNELQPYLLVASLDTSKTRRLYIHSGSFLADEQPDWVVFNESLDIDGEYFMRDVTAIQPESLFNVVARLRPYSRVGDIHRWFAKASSRRFSSRVDPPSQSHPPKPTESQDGGEDKFMYLQTRFSRAPVVNPLKEADSIGTALLGVFIALFGITFACVPLYEFFCQQSGYMGTTRRVKTYKPPPDDRGGRMFEIDFVTHSHLNWDFKPAQRSVVIGAGETTLAFYTVKNLTDQPVIGVAAYHVIPDEAGGFFNKIQCFCFEEQMLHPGEEVDLPVLFFLDPDILKDKRLYGVDKITLTYTFFEANSEIPPEYTTLLNRNNDNEEE